MGLLHRAVLFCCPWLSNFLVSYTAVTVTTPITLLLNSALDSIYSMIYVQNILALLDIALYNLIFHPI